ncbi:MAG: transposase [Pseudomonadota bacterium]
MARMPRLVVPGYPHQLTQRGNRRMKTFSSDDHYRAYLELIVEHRADAGLSVWAYCLKPNHVHLVLVPDEEASLARLFWQVHRKYTRFINAREMPDVPASGLPKSKPFGQ